jgi:hypothetical protein
MLEIGTRLREVRNALYHGEWERWLDAEFAWSARTALRYMAAAKAFADKSDMVSDLPIDIGALYLLARPRTPEEARLTAIQRAELGEHITLAVAQQIAERASRYHNANGRLNNLYRRLVLNLPPAEPKPEPPLPRDLKPLIARCVEENFARNGFDEPFSWMGNTPTEIGEIMVAQNPERAVRVARAIIRALAESKRGGSSKAPRLQQQLDEVLADSSPKRPAVTAARREVVTPSTQPRRSQTGNPEFDQ